MPGNNATSGVRVPPPLYYLAGIGSGFGLDRLWPLALGPAPWALGWRLVGAALGVLAVGLALWAVATFRGAGTTPNPMRPTTALAFGGPYRFTRNPMYLGLATLQIAAALLGLTVWPLLTLPLVVWVVRRQVIDREERYLMRKFGEPYALYQARVRRWL